MKKIGVFLILSIFFLALASASLSVQKKENSASIISELDSPAKYKLIITNNGEEEQAEIYTLLGIPMSPKGSIELPKGTTELDVKAFIPENVRGVYNSYNFEYEIKGSSSGIIKDILNVKIIKLKDALEIGNIAFYPDDSQVNVLVKNTKDIKIDEFSLSMKSEFFDSEYSLSLLPFEQKNISIKVDKNKLLGVESGKYVLNSRVLLESADVSFSGVIDYLEKKSITEDYDSSGFLVRNTKITRTNDGNVPVSDSIEINRDALTRLFTSYSLTPVSTDRNVFSVKYRWEKEVSPGDSWTLSSSTNYTLPFILLILIVGVVFFVYKYSRTKVVVGKRVSYVRTKTGQFALKVQLRVKSRASVDNVQVVDRLPGMTIYYEKFGTKPDRIDSSSNRLFWSFKHLGAGEERVITYIIYSKIRVVGRFELPSALAVFDSNGKTEEVSSNRAYFISGTARVDD